MTAPVTPSETHETPCTACGMCCDGTLYARAKVAEGEEGRITAKGLQLTSFEEKPYFQLPCSYLSCARCTIYEERFVVCRTFECALLRRFKAGEVGMDEALKLVATAKELRAAVVATDPLAHQYQNRLETWDSLSKQLPALEGEERRAIGQRLVQILALDTFLERWFRNEKRKFK